jgi:hypothetical protein
MAMLGLYVPTKAPWYPDLRAQLLSFPAGKFSARDTKVRCYRAFGMTLPPCLCGGPLLFDLPAALTVALGAALSFDVRYLIWEVVPCRLAAGSAALERRPAVPDQAT